MALYNFESDSLTPVLQTTFQAEGIRERSDIQRLLRNSIEVIDESFMVLAEEYGNWQDSRRRIDLLCIDQEANLVIVEIKRTEDGGHMELQAIRYAAMVSAMTFANAVEAHEKYRVSIGLEAGKAKEEILKFIEAEELEEEDFGNDVRICLVSAEFSKEITSSVLWLNEHELDIRCIRFKPYKNGNQVLLDVQQIVPLPEAADYQTRIKEKASEKRKLRNFNPDFTKYDLVIDGELYPNLPKRRLILHITKACIKAGASPESIAQDMPSGSTRWLMVDGEVDRKNFEHLASQIKNSRGTNRNMRRYFTEQEDLVYYKNRTYALTNQWGMRAPPTAQKLIDKWLAGKAEIQEVKD